jgi:AcrR family transcriptional regulator
MDARSYPAKATPKSQRTRARILDAAMRLFAEVGYHAASNAVIADAARLTRGAMLYHFATREELVEAAIAHIELHRARLFEQAAAGPPPAGADAAENAIDVYWSLLQELPFVAFAELEAAARTDGMLARLLAGARSASTMPRWAATASAPWSRPATTHASRPAATSAASCWKAWPRAR